MSRRLDDRTLFACTWCGQEQILLDLNPRAVEQTASDWLREHEDCDPHDEPRRCALCGIVSPVQPVDVPTVIGLQTFDEQAYADWLAEHKCGGPSPAARLAALDQNPTIYHHGDASKILPFPRPSWADPARDAINPAGYRSAPVSLPLALHDGEFSDTDLVRSRAEVYVAAPDIGVARGDADVCLSLHRYRLSEWERIGASLTIAEARRLSAILSAAADLAESEAA